MYDLPTLQTELIRDEGLRLKPYVDTVGKVTIGCGHNLTDKGITEEIAYAVLADDITDAEHFLDNNLGWWRDLDDVRQRVMLNLAFNMQGSLLTFHDTLTAIQSHEWQAAHDGLLASKYASQVGQRAVRLANMLLTGETQ